MRNCSLVVLALAIVLSSQAVADNPPESYRNEWRWYVDAGASNGTDDYDGYQMYIGVSPLATDGWNGESPVAIEDAPNGYALTWHEKNTGGWLGDTGFYREDFHAPIPPGQTKSWLLYVWATPSVPDDYTTCGFHLANVVPGKPSETYDTQFHVTLLSKPSSITGGPDVGTAWEINMQEWQIALPIYRTDNGLTGYLFEFSATAVPEPSSLVALIGGFGCLSAFRKRRRS